MNRIIGIIILLFFFSVKSLWGVEQQVVHIGVKTGICGNSVIEGEEDCEGGNLNGQNCQKQGYISGLLGCDAACSFIYSGCILVPTLVTFKSLNPGLREILYSLDPDMSGKIEKGELDWVVDKWVKSWRGMNKKQCDLSGDSQCNIVDFSILMYYIDRKI